MNTYRRLLLTVVLAAAVILCPLSQEQAVAQVRDFGTRRLVLDNDATGRITIQTQATVTNNYSIALPTDTAGAHRGLLLFTNAGAGALTTSFLASGSNGQVLTIVAGSPTWAASTGGWALTGNAGTTPGTNFLGTTDAQDFVLRTNNVERAWVLATGEVGLGVTPAAGRTLHVAGTAGTANVRLGSVSGAAIATAFTPTANDGFVMADVNGDLLKRTVSSVLNTTAWLIGGNTVGAAGALGTNDAFDLNIRTNSLTRIAVTSGGDIALAGTAGTPNVTLTSAGGAVNATLPVGYDRALIANSTGLVSQASYNAIVSATAWSLTGNTGINPATNFLGTTDAQPVVVRTNNTERIRVTATGEVGIGSITPTTSMDIDGGLVVRPPAVVAVNANNFNLAVGNRSYLVLNPAGANRTGLILGAGLQPGQILVLRIANGQANTIQLPDAAPNNVNTSGNWVGGADDTMTLIWSGTQWIELSRSNN